MQQKSILHAAKQQGHTYGWGTPLKYPEIQLLPGLTQENSPYHHWSSPRALFILRAVTAYKATRFTTGYRAKTFGACSSAVTWYEEPQRGKGGITMSRRGTSMGKLRLQWQRAQVTCEQVAGHSVCLLPITTACPVCPVTSFLYLFLELCSACMWVYVTSRVRSQRSPSLLCQQMRRWPFAGQDDREYWTRPGSELAAWPGNQRQGRLPKWGNWRRRILQKKRSQS